jgi:hypothetical protein
MVNAPSALLQGRISAVGKGALRAVPTGRTSSLLSKRSGGLASLVHPAVLPLLSRRTPTQNPPRMAADGFWAKQFTLNKAPWLSGPVKRTSEIYPQVSLRVARINEVTSVTVWICDDDEAARGTGPRWECCFLHTLAHIKLPDPPLFERRSGRERSFHGGGIGNVPSRILPVVSRECASAAYVGGVRSLPAQSLESDFMGSAWT